MDKNKNKLVAGAEPNYSFYGILPHKEGPYDAVCGQQNSCVSGSEKDSLGAHMLGGSARVGTPHVPSRLNEMFLKCPCVGRHVS